MKSREIIHFVEPDIRMRADLARTAFAMGHHAEVYASLAELCEHPPQQGIMIVRDDPRRDVEQMLDELAAHGIWLPLVAMDEEPRISAVVSAVKAGALDYLPLPLRPQRFATMLERIGEEAREQAEARRKMIDARNRIGNLSQREREVLDWLALGNSNKAIARVLEISPRTVEIHRASMMAKLGANHAAEAVRLKLEARLG